MQGKRGGGAVFLMQVKTRKGRAWYICQMKKILIVYYSRSGYTHRCVEVLAGFADADVEPISEDRTRKGIAEFFRSAIEAYRRHPVEIHPARLTPGTYDLVVFGTPVWAGRICSPMLGYLKAYKNQIDRYAVFCTVGGSDGTVALDEFAEIIGKPAEAELIVTDKEIDAGKHRLLLERFAERLNGTDKDHGDVGT